MTGKTATLTVGDKSINLPIYSGTLGPDVIDVKDVLTNGYFTYDPGFMATSACESKITFIDGDKGILLHRGYPIDQLAEKSDFLETCYLLLNGELPNAPQKPLLKNSLATTPWFTNSYSSSIVAFAVTRTLWR